jgi:hypothetical protein
VKTGGDVIMRDLSRDEFENWMEVLRDDIKGVHERLDALNGRTRTNERDIAVLVSQYAAGKDVTARRTAWGSAGLGALGVLFELWKHKP